MTKQGVPQMQCHRGRRVVASAWGNRRTTLRPALWRRARHARLPNDMMLLSMQSMLRPVSPKGAATVCEMSHLCERFGPGEPPFAGPNF